MVQQENTNINESKTRGSNNEGWEKIMGDDIMMKVLDTNGVKNCFEGQGEGGGDIDPVFVADNPTEQGEVGDFILISFDAYCGHTEDQQEAQESAPSHTQSSTTIDYLERVGCTAAAAAATTTTYSGQKGNSSSPTVSVEPFMQARNWLITLGNGDVLPGLELAVRFLKLDQCAIVKCHSKYAYGETGKNENGVILPPNTTVIYKLQIKSILSQSDAKVKTIPFQIKMLQQLKMIGNHYYKNDWVGPDGGHGKKKALKIYSEISKDGITLLQDLEHGSTERREIFNLTVDSLNNTVAVHLREKEYRKAKDVAAQAIQLDPYNLKSLLRAAKSALMVGEFEECKMALAAAEEVADEGDPDETYTMKHVQRLKRELVQKKREHKKLEKEIYAQMLSGNKKDSSTKKAKDSDAVLEKADQNNNSTIKSGGKHYVLVPIVAIFLYFLQQQLTKKGTEVGNP